MSPPVTVFLCGDVMTGRGVDQILPRPGDPRLWERFVRDARDYVGLAEAADGPIPRPVDVTWPWGDALRVIEEIAPDVRILNLETSITRRGEPARGKQIHYRMAPENVSCLTVARPDVCALANNHVLDFGHSGLEYLHAGHNSVGV
ncbi:poly-gamma-glutamate capsule biosynthesis protein CapA/YwtB (metallophosphatase superfamily) [Kibdelosporangium banguiense]|uniref:Poly-gamma-glutamate capsule biosynthesis protein CapA/YwtB (Metallophosphatase superfamily) n=1 Tax=Kibdelosporangium banguiense TaxID=1365924 RepID=A0ABS4TWD5_9PSEU|nr:poly-gamma-glutamate capsule biosynthesis protein CapA/YwtB (metallophosphatase superfamily) [Kibdelosporangium banguiense]